MLSTWDFYIRFNRCRWKNLWLSFWWPCDFKALTSVTTQGAQRGFSSQTRDGYRKSSLQPFSCFAFWFLFMATSEEEAEKRVLGSFFQQAGRTSPGPQTQEGWGGLRAEKWPQQQHKDTFEVWLCSPLWHFPVFYCASKGMFPFLFTLGITWSCWPISRQHLYCLLQQIREVTCSFIQRVVSVVCGGRLIAAGLEAHAPSWSGQPSLALVFAGTGLNAVCLGPQICEPRAHGCVPDLLGWLWSPLDFGSSASQRVLGNVQGAFGWLSDVGRRGRDGSHVWEIVPHPAWISNVPVDVAVGKKHFDSYLSLDLVFQEVYCGQLWPTPAFPGTIFNV